MCVCVRVCVCVCMLRLVVGTDMKGDSNIKLSKVLQTLLFASLLYDAFKTLMPPVPFKYLRYGCLCAVQLQPELLVSMHTYIHTCMHAGMHT